MKVCELSRTVTVEDLKPGDTFEYAGKAYLMTELRYDENKGFVDGTWAEEVKGDPMFVGVGIENGNAIYMFHDEEVTQLDLKAVRQ